MIRILLTKLIIRNKTIPKIIPKITLNIFNKLINQGTQIDQ